jgi:hypothetical protein
LNTDQQYASKFRRLLKDFEEGGVSFETDADVVDAFLKLCLDLGRLRQPNTVDTRGKELIDRATLKKMATWDTDDPSLSTIEKIFSRLAEGRGIAAVTLLKNAIKLRAEQTSSEQSRRASTKRKPHPLDNVISKMVKRDPDISAKVVIEKLKASAPDFLLSSVEDGQIFFTDLSLIPLEVSGIPSRLLRIKKKLK